MSTAATSFPERNAAEVADLVLAPGTTAPEVQARRARQRRQMYIGQVHGHPIGDEVLRTFAISIFANIRPTDSFGRYGGEEFLLLPPGTSGDASRHMLERLRQIVADLDWSAFSPGMHVTISAGVVTLHDNDTADTFLARADRALIPPRRKGAIALQRADQFISSGA